MPSSLKSIVHTLATIASFYVSAHTGDPAMQLTLGTVVAFALNWVISHSIPTTTGASANQ